MPISSNSITRVRAPDAARVALAAGAQRPQRDAPSDLELGPAPVPDGDDRPRDLVALDARELRAARRVGELAGEEVVVGAADPDGLAGARAPLPARDRAGSATLGHAHRADRVR